MVEQTLRSNYYGTLDATERFLPLIRDGGRLVHVSSMSGHLNKYSDSLRRSFLNAKTVPEITAMMEKFREAVKNGDEKQQGWPRAAYAVSKAGILIITFHAVYRSRHSILMRSSDRCDRDDQGCGVSGAAEGLTHPHQCMLSRICSYGYDKGQRDEDARSGCSDAGFAGTGEYWGPDRPLLAE